MDPMISVQLRTINNLVRRHLENNSHKEEIDRITGTNGWIIFYLAQNRDRDIYQKDLEKEIHVTRSTASKVLRLMEEKDLIKRESVPQDARLKKLTLTKRSLEILDLIRQDQEALEARITKDFTSEELTVLSKFLCRMKNNLCTSKGAECFD